MTGSEKTTAAIEGPASSAGPSGWVEHCLIAVVP
jgi:hypothetical protein